MNHFVANQVLLLQANNIASNSTADCDYLRDAVNAWRKNAWSEHASMRITRSSTADSFLLFAQVLPVRCSWQRHDGVITWCPPEYDAEYEACSFWNQETPYNPDEATPEYFASVTASRVGGIVEASLEEKDWPSDFYSNAGFDNATFHVRAMFNENITLSFA